MGRTRTPGNVTPKVLVICNAYPSNEALYRNGFIHRRVRGYVEAGLGAEVFYNHEPVSDPYTYEFDGVKVTVGDQAALEDLAKQRRFDAYLVHFAEPSRIRPLERAGVKEPIIVWVHGFEAESWYRRWFNFTDSAEAIRAALRKKEEYYRPQNAFLNELASSGTSDLTFVNVSRWFKEFVVEPDIGAEMPESYIIPNIVDEEVFPYHTKEPKDRLNLLSIRPYASYKYANDITVSAILELSKRPFFDELSFTLCGQGPLFDDITRPVANFDNVTLLNKFFTQEEVARLHSENGIFLSPTRFDSQGVSMCEAASSGLVVLSTDIAAVPEFFADGYSGLLSPPEDYLTLANHVEELYFDSELFLRLSSTGSAAMTKKCGKSATIDVEVELILDKAGSGNV